MKRLLLVPFLLGLLISNSALAGRPDPKKKLIRQQQKNYISDCNNADKFSACNKIFKRNRIKITNEAFINAKKIEAIKTLEKCTILKDGQHYERLANGNLQDKTEVEKLSWLGREITKEEYKIMYDLDRKYSEERSRRVEQWEKEKRENKNKKKEPEVRAIDIVRFCERVLKENLKDPDSYKRLNSRDNQIATGYIRYSATNSFGGRVQEVYKCFDP